MITKTIGDSCNILLQYLVRRARDSRLSPNLLTALGLLTTAVAAFLFALGRHALAASVLFVGGAFDMLDGRVARLSGRVTEFGAFLDSIVDRYSDIFLFIGIMIFYSTHHSTGYVILTGVVLMGSIMVSYTRSRAESMIRVCKGGFMERPERVVLVILAGWFNSLPMALWILALLTHIAVFQRIHHTYKMLQIGENLASSPAVSKSEPIRGKDDRQHHEGFGKIPETTTKGA